ncbi:MAG: PAS domain-containing protein, partial [Gemmatimonadales bacterium]
MRDRPAAGASPRTHPPFSPSQRVIASLSDSERFLAAALDALSAHIAILDSAGAIIAINEPWRRFGSANGYGDADPGLGTNYLAVCDAAAMSGSREGAEAAAGIREVAAGSRDEFSLEYACHVPTVEERWFEMRARRLPSDRGTCVVIAHECITERRQAEAELRAIFKAMHDVVLVLSREGRYVKVAPTGAPLLYRPAEDLVGRTVHQVLPREMADLTVETIGRSLATGRRVEVEYQLEIGGELLCFAAALTPMTEETVAWVARDVTAARRGEEALRESEWRHRVLFERNPLPMWLFDAETLAILAVNDAAVEHYGYSREEFLGLTIMDLRPQEAIPELLASRPAAGSGRNRAEAALPRRQGGSLIWIGTVLATL